MMNLKEIRKERGMTQGELAKKANSTQSAIARYEAGNREPNLKMLNNLSSALNCTLDELIGEPKTEEK